MIQALFIVCATYVAGIVFYFGSKLFIYLSWLCYSEV